MVGRKLIAKVKGSKEGKVLLSNFAYLSVLQIAGYVFPLLTLPYLARVIGASGFGKIAFASAIMVWIQTVTDWGFNYTATRDVARCRDDKQRVSEIFSNVFWARCLLMVLSFVVLAVLVFTIPKLRAEADVIFVSFLMIPGHILFPDWFFQAIERMKYITILNLLSKMLFTIAVFVFVREANDYILQPLFVSLGFVVSGIVALYYILGKWHYHLNRPVWTSLCGTIQKSSNVFVNNLMPNLYNSFSTILLGFWGGSSAVGKFDAGNKVVNIVQQFLMIVSRVCFPFLSRKANYHKLYAQMMMVIGVCVSTMLFVLAPWIISVLFTEEFQESTIVMQIMSLSIVFLLLSNIYGTNWMIIKGYETALRNITVICSCIGFCCAFPLIRQWGYVGAAVVVALSRVLLGGGIAGWVYIKNKNQKRQS